MKGAKRERRSFLTEKEKVKIYFGPCGPKGRVKDPSLHEPVHNRRTLGRDLKHISALHELDQAVGVCSPIEIAGLVAE